MSLLIAITLNTLYVALASIFFLAIGARFKSVLCLDKISSRYFQIALSFFTGVTVFVFLWLLSILAFQSVVFSLCLATALCLSLLIYRSPGFALPPKKTLLVIVCVIVFVQLLGFSRTFDPMPRYLSQQPELVNPYLGFGTVVHSFRAGNVTQFIAEHDRFPILGQHTFQGLLASISSFSRHHSTQLTLILWLNTFTAFSVFLVYGFLRYFLGRYGAVAGTLVVALGNTLLSPFYSSITDADRPILRTTNYEALFGIATLFIATLMIYFITRTTDRPIRYLTYSTFFILGFVWNVASGQMIIVLLLLLLTTIFYYRFSKIETLIILKVGGLLCLGWIIGAATVGGMFSSGTPADNQKIPGMMTVMQENREPIALRFPRTSESGVRTRAEIERIMAEYDLPVDMREETDILTVQETLVPVNHTINPEQPSLTQKVKNHPFTFGTAKIIRSFQVVFFPLLGLILAWHLIRRDLIPKPASDFFLYVTCITTVGFLFGWIMSTIFIVYGYYSWELSRFLYFGAFMSMMLLALSGAMLYQNFSPLKKFLLLVVFIFILLGPSSELIIKSAGDFILGPEMRPEMTGAILDLIPEDNRQPMTLYERLEFLIDSNHMFGTEYR